MDSVNLLPDPDFHLWAKHTGERRWGGKCRCLFLCSLLKVPVPIRWPSAQWPRLPRSSGRASPSRPRRPGAGWELLHHPLWFPYGPPTRLQMAPLPGHTSPCSFPQGSVRSFSFPLSGKPGRKSLTTFSLLVWVT